MSTFLEDNYDQSTWTPEERETAKGLRNMYVVEYEGQRTLCGMIGSIGIAHVHAGPNKEWAGWEAINLSTGNMIGWYDTNEQLLADHPEFRDPDHDFLLESLK